jgi:hypothetical protein
LDKGKVLQDKRLFNEAPIKVTTRGFFFLFFLFFLLFSCFARFMAVNFGVLSRLWERSGPRRYPGPGQRA